MHHLQPQTSLTLLPRNGREFVELFRHGSLVVEVYRPDGADRQTPHSRDELYVVISGRGSFVMEDARARFGPGDVFFVPAGATHRFEDFTDDFATWVFSTARRAVNAPGQTETRQRYPRL